MHRARGGTPLVDDRLALLPQELLHVVVAPARLAGRGAALPATERLNAGPGTRRCARTPVHVYDACLVRVEEPRDLRLVLPVEAGGQTVDVVVGQAERLVNRVHGGDRGERHEEFLAEQPM